MQPLLDSLAAVARRTPKDVWLMSSVGGRVFDDPRATRFVLDSVIPDHLVWINGWSGEQVLAMGITSVQDMTVGYELDRARAVARRASAMRPHHRVIRFPIPAGRTVISNDWRVSGADTALAPTMHISGVKWVLDGTPVEQLALMRRPYADRPGWYGRANFPFDTLRAIVRDALRRREQPMLHAVGDSTIALVIAAMRAEGPDSAWRALRPRLEHADALGRDQLADIKKLGIIVVQNPAHLAIPEIMHARWGAERLRRIDMMRSLLDSGVTLAIGSDGPLEPGLNVMLATLHPNVPSEALTREQAVIAYTRQRRSRPLPSGNAGRSRRECSPISWCCRRTCPPRRPTSYRRR
ncbi:MAG: amidohydrolase family protein [Gemmatimonadetes bacterium]|nr:amidohydrolase family protein [Gemmatimonadota bacterium]